jgi:hypothetical protein
MIGIVTGSLVMLAGALVVLIGGVERASAASTIAGVGGTLIIGVLGMKALQRGAEAKIANGGGGT